MIINLIFDQNPPASFTSAINSAALILDRAITDPITVTIEVGYGVFPTDHSPVTDQLAQAEPNFALVSSGSVSSVVSALNAGAAPSDTNFDALTSAVVASGGTAITGYNGTISRPYTQVLLWSAEAKALGLIPANQSGIDGFAGFATDINPNSLIGVALHELTHALGRAPSGLPLQPFGDIPDIFDLFRFDSANNTRLVDGDFGSAPPAYFSVSSGGAVLANYGQTSDPGDFLNDSYTSGDPFDEFYQPGVTSQSLTLLDLTQLDVLGFNTVTATFSWANPEDGVFAVASNWTSGGTSPSTTSPVFNDNVLITVSGATSYTVSSTANQTTINSLVMAAGATLDIISGVFTIDNGTNFYTTSGIIEVSGGATLVLMGEVVNAGTIVANGASTGTLTVGDGRHTANLVLLGNYMAGSFVLTATAARWSRSSHRHRSRCC
jgi:hypothetical protein